MHVKVHFSQTIPCVNMIKNQGLFNAPGKTQYNKQYNEQHKEQTRKYCEQHKNQLKEYKQKYHEQHKEKRKVQMKLYHEQHRDQHKLQMKQYREQNKEKLNQNKSTVINCQCGCSYTRTHKSRHKGSEKHQEYENNRLYCKIKIGLDMIKIMDKHLSNHNL